MIALIQKIIVPHNDKRADAFKRDLTKEDGWHIEEDTVARIYTKTLYSREVDDETQ